MDTLQRIVTHLVAEGPSSVEGMTRELGINESELWENLEQINSDFPFIVERNGLLVPQNVSSKLSEKAIIEGLDADVGDLSVRVVHVTGSTNDDLLAMFRSGAQNYAQLLIAENQASGRGTCGRSWISFPGGTLTFSMSINLESKNIITGLSALTLVVGLSVVKVLRKLQDSPYQIKWPNDVLFEGKKLAGILVETVPVGDGLGLVIGVGINTRLPEVLRNSIDQPVTDLYESGLDIDRNILVAEIVLGFRSAIREFLSVGFEPFISDWIEVHAFHGQEVEFILPDHGNLRGIIRGVDLDGSLIVEESGVTKSYASGEIRFKP